MSDTQIEVYRQRYETWRHLDKLRWQMVQFLIAIGSGTAIALRISSGATESWFWIMIGAAVFLIAVVMNRISDAIRGNSKVLKAAGATVGDTELPDIADLNKSVTHWLTLGIGMFGLLLVVKGVFFH